MSTQAKSISASSVLVTVSLFVISLTLCQPRDANAAMPAQRIVLQNPICGQFHSAMGFNAFTILDNADSHTIGMSSSFAANPSRKMQDGLLYQLILATIVDIDPVDTPYGHLTQIIEGAEDVSLVNTCPNTSSPPPVPPSAPSPLHIDFRADTTTLVLGNCTTLRWDVDNVKAVYLDGQPTVGHHEQQVCPSSTTNYMLRVVTDNGEDVRTVTVSVVAPPPVSVPPTAPVIPSVIKPSQSCGFGQAIITSPTSGQTLRGTVPVKGTALCDGFAYYKFEFVDPRCGSTGLCFVAGKFTHPVQNGLLMNWDTTKIPDGTYVLRLTVVGVDNPMGNVLPQVSEITITIGNSIPIPKPVPAPVKPPVAPPASEPIPAPVQLPVQKPVPALAQVLPLLQIRVDSHVIVKNECTILRWDAAYINKLYLDEKDLFQLHGTKRVCLKQDQTYRFRAVWSGKDLLEDVVVKVADAPKPRIEAAACPTKYAPGPCTRKLILTQVYEGVYLDFAGSLACASSSELERDPKPDESNPLGYYQKYTTYVGWVYYDATGRSYSGWFKDAEKGAVVGPREIVQKFSVPACGLPLP